MKKILISVMVFSLIGLMAGFGMVAKANTTALSLAMSAGALTINDPADASFAGKNVTDAAQDSAATISGLAIQDLRGTGAGWSATMTVTNLVTKSAVKKLAGNNSTVDFTGTYDGLQAAKPGTFIVEITTGGAVETAVFSWTDPDGAVTQNVTTAASVVLSNGISVTFGAATYVIGDKWSVGVDSLVYGSLTVTPSSITVVSGQANSPDMKGSAGVMAGSAATSDAKAIMTATSNHGMGSYTIDIGLSQNIHAYPLSGSYSSTATLTVS